MKQVDEMPKQGEFIAIYEDQRGALVAETLFWNKNGQLESPQQIEDPEFYEDEDWSFYVSGK